MLLVASTNGVDSVRFSREQTATIDRGESYRCDSVWLKRGELYNPSLAYKGRYYYYDVDLADDNAK